METELSDHYIKQSKIFQSIISEFADKHQLHLQSCISNAQFYVTLRVGEIDKMELVLYPIERLSRQLVFDHDRCRDQTILYLKRIFYIDENEEKITIDRPLWKAGITHVNVIYRRPLFLI